MSVVSCLERIEDKGRSHVSGQKDYTRVYDVLTDNPSDTVHLVGSYVGLPGLFMPHPDNLNALCLEIRPERVDAQIFVVYCEYSTTIPREVARYLSNPHTGGQNSPSETADQNPLNRPTRWRASSVKYVEAVEKDRFDRWILNSAGEPYDPAPTRQRARLKLTCSRNLPAFNIELAASMVGGVNDRTYLGMPAGTLYFDDFTCEQGSEHGTRFFDTEVVWVVEPDGWKISPMESGMQYLDNGTLKPIILPGGQRPTKPIPLNLYGDVLQTGLTPVFTDWEIYDHVDFSQLGIF